MCVLVWRRCVECGVASAWNARSMHAIPAQWFSQQTWWRWCAVPWWWSLVWGVVRHLRVSHCDASRVAIEPMVDNVRKRTAASQQPGHPHSCIGGRGGLQGLGRSQQWGAAVSSDCDARSRRTTKSQMLCTQLCCWPSFMHPFAHCARGLHYSVWCGRRSGDAVCGGLEAACGGLEAAWVWWRGYGFGPRVW